MMSLLTFEGKPTVIIVKFCGMTSLRWYIFLLILNWSGCCCWYSRGNQLLYHCQILKYNITQVRYFCLLILNWVRMLLLTFKGKPMAILLSRTAIWCYSGEIFLSIMSNWVKMLVWTFKGKPTVIPLLNTVIWCLSGGIVLCFQCQEDEWLGTIWCFRFRFKNSFTYFSNHGNSCRY